MLRKVIHILVWLGVIAYLVMALAFTERMELTQKVGYIRIEMMDSAEFQFIDREDVIKVLDRHGFEISGMPFDSINRSRLRETVYDIAEVKNVNVFYTPDNELHINIWQRRPIVRIKSGSTDFYLDEDNLFMPFSTRFSPNVLIITGSDDLTLAQEKLFDLAVFINQDPFYRSLIQEIHIDKKQQLEIIPRVGEHRIFLGGPEDYKWKLTKLMTFYHKALPNTGWSKYYSIDLRYGDQVVCKKVENKSKNLR